ncbi:hypothetical protein DSO57_1030038 [Entomophthora muscae]|uniref:Uncharacterized protein n=1 Tax=Entomophthora muscae TaxID=34485 RepID=A0ACC2TC88_9FUNG|nr:hypothetical protein DSO57_1030038 [Entomophthora muscae]
MDLSSLLLHKAKISQPSAERAKFAGIEEISSVEIEDSSEDFLKKLEVIYSSTAIPGSVFHPGSEVEPHPDIDAWRQGIRSNLIKLDKLAEEETFEAIDEQCKAFICTIPFMDAAPWTDQSIREVSRRIFNRLFQTSKKEWDFYLIRTLLNVYIRPRFESEAPRPVLSFQKPSTAEEVRDHSYLSWKVKDARMYLVLKWLFSQNIDLTLHSELIIPPSLVVVYDYEESFRLVGLTFLTAITKQTPRAKFKGSGLSAVFAEAAKSCLLYVPDDGSIRLADSSLELLIKLLDASERPGEKEYYRYIQKNIIQPALKRGTFTSSGDLASRRWLLTRLSVLMRMSGPYLIAYIQKFIDAACSGLELPGFKNLQLDSDLPLRSCQLIQEIVGFGTCRLPYYASRILIAITRCWAYACGETTDLSLLKEEILKTFKQVYELSDKDVVKRDICALCDLDSKIFLPLKEIAFSVNLQTLENKSLEA